LLEGLGVVFSKNCVIYSICQEDAMKKVLLLSAFMLILFSACIYYTGYPPSYVQYVYYGAHPIPSYLGGGMCYINGRHIHEYPPENEYAFYYYENTYFYIGTSITYYGPHPIPPQFGGGICMIHGYHTHNYYPSGGGYVYYPDDNVFVYVDVDINVADRRPYEPKNRHGEYHSGIPYSDRGGKHEFTPQNSSTPGSNQSGSHGFSGGGSESPSSQPVITGPQRPDINYTPKKYEPAQPQINTPSQTNKRVEPYQPTINTPSQTEKRVEPHQPAINTPSQAEKRVEPYQPTINTPSQTNKRIEPEKPVINTPEETNRRPDFNKGPKKFDTPSSPQFTPKNYGDKGENKNRGGKNLPSIDNKKKDSSTDDEEEDRKIKKVYKKDEIKIPGVNKKVPSPDPQTK
jgi:hypothetical protein